MHDNAPCTIPATLFRMSLRWVGTAALVGVLAVLPRGGATKSGALVVGNPQPVSSIGHGQFELVTYNVAGLPFWLTGRDPASRMAEIGRRLRAYDLALVQEDFAGHEALVSPADHPYRSARREPGLGAWFGDGLSRLSRLPFDRLVREPWETCNGTFADRFDCWASKGFSFARHQLGVSSSVDVYNIHLDAGPWHGDFVAKRAQVDQLVRAVRRSSRGRALIVAGDTNLKHFPGLAKRLKRRLSLRRACEELGLEGDRTDRVYVRSGKNVRLEVRSWEFQRARFLDARSERLSDHDPVYVRLRWSRSDVVAGVSASRVSK